MFINLSVENFAGWKFALTFAIIQKSYFAGFIVYLLINLVLVFSSAYIITQFAPAAAGSGIPEIKGYLNGIYIHTPTFLISLSLFWAESLFPQFSLSITTFVHWIAQELIYLGLYSLEPSSGRCDIFVFECCVIMEVFFLSFLF